MILVTGATGKIGQEVVTRLATRGVEVRAFVRDLARGAKLRGPHVELVQGDLDDAASVARALASADTVFLLTAASPAQELELLEQAFRAGIRRIVKLSVLDASLDSPLALSRAHAQVEARLTAMPLAWTLLRPGRFAQNLLALADSIRSDGRIIGAYGEGKVAPIDVRDIADVAVAVLTEEGHVGKTYSLTGPEALSYPVMADRIAAAVGKPLVYVNVPLQTIREQMNQAAAAGRIPGWLADDSVTNHARTASGQTAQVTDDVARVLGHPARSFDTFVRDHAAAFGGPPRDA